MSAVGGLAVIGEVQVDIEIRGGIALWPAQAQTFQALLRRASVAKRASFDTWPQCLVYQPEHEVNPRTVTLVAELRAALGTDQLRLHYQPKLDLVTGRVTSAEALLRWKHPDHGFVPPGEFIALAEQTGLITSVTAWVVDRVLAQIQAWRLAGVDIDISLNISARDLRSPGFVELVRTLRDAYDTEPGSVTLELTESTVMKEPERGIQVLGQLKEQGFRLSLDDFGTGYSSLAYLKRLDFHELKIDRAFVTDMLSDREDAYIVRSIVALGHELGMSVTAEGVEEDATLAELKRLGCDLAQGFGISRPLDADTFVAWLRDADGWHVPAVPAPNVPRPPQPARASR